MSSAPSLPPGCGGRSARCHLALHDERQWPLTPLIATPSNAVPEKFGRAAFTPASSTTPIWETALRFVELNPIRTRIVDRIEDFRWSSARAHLGLEPSPAWLDTEQLHRRWYHAAEWQSSLDTLTRREAAALRMATLHDAVWGSDEFVAGFERTHGVQLRTKPLGRSWPHPAKAPRSAGAAAGEVQLQA